MAWCAEHPRRDLTLANLTGGLFASAAGPLLGACCPDPTRLGVQSGVTLGDGEERRGESLRPRGLSSACEGPSPCSRRSSRCRGGESGADEDRRPHPEADAGERQQLGGAVVEKVEGATRHDRGDDAVA